MRLLLSNGASINFQSSDKRTALHRACRGGHLEAVRALLHFGADRMIRDETWKISLHRAAKGGHKDIVNLLLDTERDLQSRQLHTADQFSMTPHDVALAAGYYELAKDLRIKP
jgi:ankyrin repeat protein